MEYSALNQTIKSECPAAHACLSGLGRRLYYPQGVPAQAADARNCAINATIGQLTDGRGGAMPLPSMARHLSSVSMEKVFLYSPQGGHPELRDAWGARQQQHSGNPGALEFRTSRPVVTNGLTHGLSLIADLFVDVNTPVLVPYPGWGNYQHIFGTRRGGRMVPYSVMTDDGFSVAGLAEALAATDGPALLVLNFPSNPIGYAPTLEESRQIVDVVKAHSSPLVVLCDDAYEGMVWEPNLMERSLFWQFAGADPERLLPVKVDGATKEMFFFGGRVGFITFGATGACASALEEKVRACARATVSSPPAISQAVVSGGLASADLEGERLKILDALRGRYRMLRDNVEELSLPAWPFNAGFFALIRCENADAEQVRRQLLARGVGVVAFPAVKAIRLVYASVPLDSIPELAQEVHNVLRGKALN